MGQLNHTTGYAEIAIDILNSVTEESRTNLKAVIDTGKANSIIDQSLLKTLVSEDKFLNHSGDLVTDSCATRRVIDIFIRLAPVMREHDFIQIPFVLTGKLDNDSDAIIGNDILSRCEFLYSGLSQTYVIKVFQEKR